VSSAKQIATTPEGKFAQQIEALVKAALRQQRFVIPTFAADPPESDPTNLWMRYDGRLRGRYWNGSGYTYVDYPMRSDITSPPAVPAYPPAPSAPAAPLTYTTTWSATWSQTYTGTGVRRTDPIGETSLVSGMDSTGTYGQQKALAGFDGTAIATALAGSTILGIRLTLTVLGAYWATGGEVYFGQHNLTSEPTTFDPATASLRYNSSAQLVPGGMASVNLPLSYAQELRSGTAKGLVFEAITGDQGALVQMAGVGSGYTEPQLTITYAK
jgi:hypothetical protein